MKLSNWVLAGVLCVFMALQMAIVMFIGSAWEKCQEEAMYQNMYYELLNKCLNCTESLE